MKKILLSLALFASVASASAASLESTAKTKIGELNALVEQAKKRKIDTRREDCALWMANEFLMYAAWDEQNIDQNEYQYTTWKPYKAEARRLAEELPSFEREEVIKMLDTAIDELTGVISGKYTRRPTVQIDWSSIKPEGNQFYSNSHPTYFNSYFTIPDHQCNEYVGIPRSSGLNINMIRNFDGGISPNGEKQLGKISDKYSGYVLLWHGGAPKWIRDIDPDCAIGKRLFTHYDIDNPTIRKAWEATFKEFVPKIAQTKAADMGYVLANEPHWMSIEKRWATGEVSDHTKAKFRTWLEAKHKDIARLNKLWGSSFSSFDEVDITVPISKTILLKAQGYDWMRFNMDRVTEWFTFLNDGVKEYDPKAKTHIKIIPHMLSNDYLDHGLDMEQLYTLTDIVGNDAKIVKRSPFKKDPEQWEARYAFNWEEVALSYDFFHSVNPKGANINSESHFLSASQFRDIYMTKEFTRTAYWLATLHGMSGSFSWFWAREKDGEVRKDLQKRKDQFDNAMNSAYVASVVQQPRVANEVAKTYMDLNAFAPEIAQMQSLRRPIRIYYSNASALNKRDHMTNQFKLYESIYFEGVPLGFVTSDILSKQELSQWDVVLVKDSEYILESEIDALQSYLDRGGVVVMDKKSLKFNEYKEPIKRKLKASKGQIVIAANDKDYFTSAFNFAKSESLPEITVAEKNSVGEKGCMWRSVKSRDGYIVSISNLGKSDATITLGIKDGKVKSLTDQFLGAKLKNGFKIPSESTMLIEIK